MANTFTNLDNDIIVHEALEAFTQALLPLKVFITDFSDAATEKGEKINVPFVPEQSEAQAFTGTYTVQDADAEGKDIYINKHNYVSWGLADIEISKRPQISMEVFGQQKGYKLAEKVLLDILSAVTAANYGAAAKSGLSSATFDTDEVLEVRQACTDSGMPKNSRALVLASNYHTAILKDMKDASAVGSTSSLREGETGRLGGFSVYESTILPDNAEGLVGFAAFPTGLIAAMRYVGPQKNKIMNEAYPVTDEETGITLGFRDWYEGKDAQRIRVLECNYGYAVGNPAAIKRLTSA